MSLLRRSSLRFLARHPGQLLLTVTGVALGVAVVVAIDLAIQSAREAFRVSTETVAGRATHQVEAGPGGLPDTLFTRIRVDAGVRAAAPVVDGYATSPRLPGRALRVLGVDPFSEAPFRPYLAPSGSGLDVGALLTRAGTVLLSAGTAADAGVAVGDTLPLVVGGARVAVTVLGVLEPESPLGRQGLRDLVLTDVSTAQELMGMEGRLSRIDLVLPPGRGEGPAGGPSRAAPGEGMARPDGIARGGGARVTGDAVFAVEALLPPGATLRPAGARTGQMAGMLSAFDLNLTALSLLALVFGMFLIYNAMTFSVVQRRELLGALRAVGVTRREVLGLVLGEALVTGVLGTAAGLALGVALGRGLVLLVTRTINDLYFVLSVESLSTPPAVLLKGAALGLGATLLAGLPALLEAVNAPPRTSLTRSAVEDRARRLVPRAAAAGAALGALGALLLGIPSRSVLLSFAGLFTILLGVALVTPLAMVGFVRLLRPVLARTVGILGTMAARGVTASLSRTAPAVAALVVAVAVTVGLGTMIASFRGTVARWLDHTLQADVYVSLPSVLASRPGGSLPDDLFDRLTTVPGLEGVSTYRGSSLPTPEGEARLVALDLHPRGEPAYAFIERDPADVFPRFRAGEVVLVSEPFAYRRGLSVGDSVALAGDRGGAVLPVAGVFTDYGSDQGVVMVGRSAYDRLFDDPGITSLGLFLDETASEAEVIGSLEARLREGEAVTIQSNRTLREGSLEVFDRTFAITGVLRALAFAVAFIGVLSALMAVQLERARELGVLRANGLTPGQVWTLVTTQTGVMGLVAGILAVPAGIVLAVIMIVVVNKRSFGWTLQMELGPAVVLQALGLAVTGALLAGLYPAWRMSRTSPGLALREE
ncbi:MAG TPA: ABC transporter permease [Longimicrobiales bacterium]|nr:ABC transporter permease [Longimicrobiales bacterium]